MNQLPFREFHLVSLLKAYEEQTLPLDLFISLYFRHHHALGSKDRGFIAETVYKLIRWKRLVDHFFPGKPWEAKYNIFAKLDLKEIQKDQSIPIEIRVSAPSALFKLLESQYGLEEAIRLSMVNNGPAPTTVRVNVAKISREALLEKWTPLYEVSPTKESATGITFHKKINFFQLPEFREGWFEVQDEGSQLLAELVQALPGQQVLDFCAGSGGKTLAFAPRMEGKGQIYLHDSRPRALIEARKRLKRAGIQNNQLLLPESGHASKLKKKMDWILVDAPCSGTGTLRRNPDMKWKFSEEMVMRLTGLQRTIFEKALSFLKPSGKIVYATCSLLKEENENQLDHFLKTYSLEVEGSPFSSRPFEGGMDGFFGVVLKRK